MTLANPALYVWLGGQRGRAPRQTPEPSWISNGKTQIGQDEGNRGETADKAVGSLGHLGYLCVILSTKADGDVMSVSAANSR